VAVVVPGFFPAAIIFLEKFPFYYDFSKFIFAAVLSSIIIAVSPWVRGAKILFALIFGFLVASFFGSLSSSLEGTLLPPIMLTIASSLYFIVILLFASRFNIIIIQKALLIYCFFAVFSAIFISELNWLVVGRRLPLFFQNTLPLVPMFLVVIALSSYKLSKYSFAIFVVVIIYWLLSLMLVELNLMHLQFKFIIFTAFAVFLYFIFRLFGHSLSCGRWVVVLSLGIVSCSLLLYNDILATFSFMIGRDSSAYVRSVVNAVYLDKFFENLFFGMGPGSSSIRVPIPERDGLMATGHSGIVGFLYENGVVGFVLFLFILSHALRRMSYFSDPVSGTDSINHGIIFHYRYTLLGFIIIYYGLLNIVIISSIPYWEPFWLYGLGGMPVILILGEKLGRGQLH
jgi:hypothetical protein